MPGVAGTDFVRLRRNGARIVGDLGLLVSRTLPLERVAAIKAEVDAAIARRWPYVALTVTANPLALDDETVLERVLLIAGRRRLFVHHVAVQNVDERKCVTLDLEVDGRMSLAERARNRDATGERDPGRIGRRHRSRDPYRADGDARDRRPRRRSRRERENRAGAERATRRARAPCAISTTSGSARRTAAIIVIFHCRADPDVTVEAAHDRVDALERSVRDEFPDVVRIIGHAEPAR